MAERGRPIGATTRPQFHTYTTEIERKEYVQWVKKLYKRDMKLAIWYGDQLFGKASQPITGADGGALILEISEVIAKKNASQQGAK